MLKDEQGKKVDWKCVILYNIFVGIGFSIGAIVLGIALRLVGIRIGRVNG